MFSVVGDNTPGVKETEALENYIAPSFTTAFNTNQTAIQACLELLGSRSALTPIIMPVTAPPDTVAAALRSGGHPLLLDIEEDTLQMSPKQLQEALEALETPVVLLTRPGGRVVDPRLETLVEDYPTICDSRLIPHNDLTRGDLPAVFNVFDLSPVVGAGSVVLHASSEQVKLLKLVRSGVIGHDGALPGLLASDAQLRIDTDLGDWIGAYDQATDTYSGLLDSGEFPDIIPFATGEWPSAYYVKVPNAKKAIAQLHGVGVKALLGVYPLYNLEEIRRRYVEEPDYPVAEKLSNKVLCLPANLNVLGKEEKVLKAIQEVF